MNPRTSLRWTITLAILSSVSFAGCYTQLLVKEDEELTPYTEWFSEPDPIVIIVHPPPIVIIDNLTLPPAGSTTNPVSTVRPFGSTRSDSRETRVGNVGGRNGSRK